MSILYGDFVGQLNLLTAILKYNKVSSLLSGCLLVKGQPCFYFLLLVIVVSVSIKLKRFVEESEYINPLKEVNIKTRINNKLLSNKIKHQVKLFNSKKDISA